MNRYVSNTLTADRKAGLWTPWGLQRVPDLDKALEGARPRPEPRGADASLKKPDRKAAPAIR